jgi:SAM-dependent methyltransferase
MQEGRVISASGDSPLEELFDEHYPLFWQDELGGDRLARDADLVASVGQFSAGAELLDLGCGYGRLTNELAGRGYQVTGVDISGTMLAHATAEAVAAGRETRFVMGDMRDPIDGIYDGIMLWFTTFGYFEHQVNRQVLDNVFGALKSGGRLLIETRHWDRIPRQFEPTTARAGGDNWLIEKHTYLPETGVQQTVQTLLVGGRRLTRNSSVRRYGFPELAWMCRDAGFDAVSGFGGDGRVLAVDSERCVVRAERG